MRKHHLRNVLTGVFVVSSCAVIVWLAAAFKGGPALGFLRDSYTVVVALPDLDGLTQGSPMTLNGLRIGLVTALEVDPAADPPARAVVEVHRRHRIPRDARAEIISRTLGGASLSLVYLRRPTGSPGDYLPNDGSQPVVIAGRTAAGGIDGLTRQLSGTVATLETEITAAIRQATAVMTNMNGLIDKNSLAVNRSIESIRGLLDNPENQANVARALAFVGDRKLHEDIAASVAGVRAVAGDEALQASLRAIVADVQSVSADLRAMSGQLRGTTETIDKLVRETAPPVRELADSAGRIAGTIEAASRDLPAQAKAVGDRVIGDLERLSQILSSVQTVARRLETAEGTLGRLVGDPRLHEAMVDLAGDLQLITRDMRELVKKWDQGGIKFRL